MISIRRALPEDFDGIWPILLEVIQGGETFAYDPGTTKEQGRTLWMGTPVATYVVENDGFICGSYVLRRNQPGRGSHVANAGYMVSSAYRGRGLGRALCEHSLAEARGMGFRSMQFNLVVSTNGTAVRLWESCGFRILGELPEAFLHPELGYVAAYLMHRRL
jgi:ribosomal protein S18 acetylase RimI-like enzyme